MNLGSNKKRPQATRHCGFIVSDLGDVGAGSEGWIHDPSLSVVMCTHPQHNLIALAKGRNAVIVGWEGQDSDAPPLVPIHLPHTEDGPHQIKALQWLVFRNAVALAVGTSLGSVLFYSSRGALLLRQVFHSTAVLQLRVRASHNRPSRHSVVEDLCVVYSKAIVRIDTLELQPLLHRCLQDAKERSRKEKSAAVDDAGFHSPKLAHQVWNISRNIGGNATCVDGVITGVMAPPLLEHQSTQRYFCAITVGPDCALAAHRLSEDRSSSITNLIIKKIMPATVSTVTALAKILWRSNDQPSASDSRPPEVKPQDFGRSSLITSLKDRPRQGEKITLSPSGAMAAITDSLGRILLIDTQALVAIRLWKGYRDAQCFFLEVPAGDMASNSHRSSYSVRKQDLFLCLGIHAPRRGVVEVWKLRDGPRVCTIKCGSGCCVIQPASQLRGSDDDAGSEYAPALAYIFDGDSGHLSAISPLISSHDDVS